MMIDSWHFAQWFTFCFFALVGLVGFSYGGSFLILNRKEIKAYIRQMKAEKKLQKNKCPEWADSKKWEGSKVWGE